MAEIERNTRTSIDDEPLGSKTCRLVIASGPDQGSVLQLDTEKKTIGNLETCHLYLQDSFVSRCHCQITMEKGGHYIEDLDSKNGTYVNGLQITKVRLIPGALVRVGQTDLFYQVSESLDRIPPSQETHFGETLGQTPIMRKLFTMLEQIAPTDLSVLIEGETGTGKDVLARSIHAKSKVSKGPFVVVDCGAIAANLIESELFGHEKGAFTGADQQRKGVFERANQGTIFLDELGELNKDLQPKLLRVLEQQQVQRVGGASPINVKVRIIAATNRNLVNEVSEGQFRQDLFYRLSVMKIQLPPLRARKEDIPLLAEFFLAGQEKITGIGPGALNQFVQHPWPGNIRELRNMIQRAVALGKGPLLQPEDLQFEELLPGFQTSSKPEQPVLQSLEQSERDLIIRALKSSNWNKTKTAEVLKIAGSTLYAKMKRHKIKEPQG